MRKKYKSYFKRGWSLLLVGLLLTTIFLGGCAKEEEPLKMAVIPAGEAIAEVERYEPIAAYLGEQIGKEIELVVSTDYTAVITALKVGDADIARLGPFSYLLAVEEAKAEIIVRGVKKSTGKDAYHGYIISRADSGIKTLDDLKGRTFAFTDVASTSGYLIPQAVLKGAGIDPEKDFAEMFFAGSHPAVIEVVKAGKVDAGAIADNRWEDALEAGVIKEGELSIIFTTDPIPMSPEVVRSGMDPELKKKIQDAYLNMPSELSEQAVGKISGYVIAVDSDYDFLREVAKVLDLDLTAP